MQNFEQTIPENVGDCIAVPTPTVGGRPPVRPWVRFTGRTSVAAGQCRSSGWTHTDRQLDDQCGSATCDK